MMACAHERSAACDWMDLLELRRQPNDMRGCYELLAAFVKDLRTFPTIDVDGLSPQGRARLGYLIDLASSVMQEGMHPAWRVLVETVRDLGHGLTSPAPLFRFDVGLNPLDDRAAQWGLAKGMERAKLKQIVARGVC